MRRLGEPHVLGALVLLALIGVTLGRLLAPEDLYHQSQPLTISYTSDLLEHGRWIVPYAFGFEPATKPPLYNWVAAPFVALAGLDVPLAHRAPSLLALLVTTALVGVAASRAAPRGWAPSFVALALLIWLGNYATFKLGALARPDMLLAACTTGAWLCATSVFRPARPDARGPRTACVAGFWLCVSGAALAKGPAALIPVIHAIVLARVSGRSWRLLRPGPGAMVLMASIGSWLLAAWIIEPEHVVGQLLGEELAFRVTGSGSEGTHGGTVNPLIRLPGIALYYLGSFAPWSFASCAAIVALGQRRRGRARWRRLSGNRGLELFSTSAFVLTVVIFFTLSVGKRPDYVLPALPAGAVLASWWIHHVLRRAVGRLTVPLVAVALVTVAASIAWYAAQDRTAPVDGFGRRVTSFAHELRSHLRDRPAPLGVENAGRTHLQALIGVTGPEDHGDITELAVTGQPSWALIGVESDERLEDRLRGLERLTGGGEVTVVARIDGIPPSPAATWPGVVALIRLEP